MTEQSKLTPMMQQYTEVKGRYPDALVLFRMGDFFEMFFGDAKLASEVLGITLTHRNKTSSGEPIPMAGVPHHAYRNYVNRLTQEGLTVVICDQVEDARQAKGLVRRDVTRIVTPGMILDPDEIEGRTNLYLMAICFGVAKKKQGLAYLDLSTGEFRATEVATPEEIAIETQRLRPREVLFSAEQNDWPIVQELKKELTGIAISSRESREFHPKDAAERVCQHFRLASLEGMGLASMEQALRCAGALLAYVQETQKNDPPHLSKPQLYTLADHMTIDEVTLSNLELLETYRERSRKGSLFDILDHTMTSMGGRRLKQWMLYPLLDRQRIERRLAAVRLFFEKATVKDDLRASLKSVSDIERLTSKISSNQVAPRGLLLLKDSLASLPALIELLSQIPDPDGVLEPFQKLDPMVDVIDLIEKAIDPENASSSAKDGRMIRLGYNAELDEYRDIAQNGKDRLLQMQEEERKATGIGSLKIAYNKVSGYFIEVTKPNLHLVPKHFHRRQTMTNHERFITDELQEFERKILGAEETSLQLEQELFAAVLKTLAESSQKLTRIADRLATLDALLSLAHHAGLYEYCCPTLTDDTSLLLEGCRHPVVETTMKAGTFVPNDVLMRGEEKTFFLLTGPNMAGKSTIMRQVALIVLMAQMGSFVPAKSATIGICDRIFTRVGASDNLAAGQSTFMVEMTETSSILRYATSRSLVILDEIGRGTSTFDGISIAWAVAEFLHNKTRCRTLFATHYHELTELEASLERLQNLSVAVREDDEGIVFLHRLVLGGTSHSYGIQVAKIAGLPAGVVQRARRILRELEAGRLPGTDGSLPLHGVRKQMALFSPSLPAEPTRSLVEDAILELEVEKLAPFEALQLIHGWRKQLMKNL